MPGKKKFWDKSMLVFLLIGGGNMVLTMIIMFVLYEQLHAGYWLSSAIAFFLTSILSFILNKKFTFQHQGSTSKTAMRFALVIAVCYMLAYSVAQPLLTFVLRWFALPLEQTILDRLSLVAGQIIFTALNYLGQRFFAFSSK